MYFFRAVLRAAWPLADCWYLFIAAWPLASVGSRTSPQALHHFTQADQVNQLVEASEADPDLGFMARLRTAERN